ncbi:MAG TPA: flagellar biosynthesis protein FlhF [Polyangia bacterium]
MNEIVRTFRAPDPRSALEAVKAALGREAVILETREVGGFMGRAEIEVTAMRSLDTPPPPISDGNVAHASDSAVTAELTALRRVVDELRSKLSAPNPANARNDLPEPQSDRVPPEAVALCRKLARRGVDAHLAEELVEEALRAGRRLSNANLEDAVRALVARRLNPAAPPWERPERRRVMALVGPTGVGKTTTVAKLAARALLESRLRVGLITVDTYRIGASEHLGRYGEIMGLKTQVARDAASLATAVARTADCDLLLIDTAGRSDVESIANQVALLRSVPDVELHLVLSAASGAREIGAAARRHRELGVHRLIFTKLDEADGPGSIMSAVTALPRPVACATNGQRVPDDLQPATSNFLVDQVVGPPRHKESLAWTKQTA